MSLVTIPFELLEDHLTWPALVSLRLSTRHFATLTLPHLDQLQTLVPEYSSLHRLHLLLLIVSRGTKDQVRTLFHLLTPRLIEFGQLGGVRFLIGPGPINYKMTVTDGLVEFLWQWDQALIAQEATMDQELVVRMATADRKCMVQVVIEACDYRRLVPPPDTAYRLVTIACDLISHRFIDAMGAFVVRTYIQRIGGVSERLRRMVLKNLSAMVYEVIYVPLPEDMAQWGIFKTDFIAAIGFNNSRFFDRKAVFEPETPWYHELMDYLATRVKSEGEHCNLCGRS